MTAEVIAIPALVWQRGGAAPVTLRKSMARVLLLIFVFASLAGSATLWRRFQEPQPYRGRAEFLRDTVEMIRARPYFGVGLGNFQTVYRAYSHLDFTPVVNHAHNDWAEWAAEGGIPLAALMLLIALWAAPRAVRSLWGIGLLAVWAHCLVDYPLQVAALEFWFFALLGVLSAEDTVTRGSCSTGKFIDRASAQTAWARP